MPDRPLTDLLPISWGEPATVAALLGQPWDHTYRALHPAADSSGRPIIWSALAASRGETVDLRVADWYEVSGSRLHHPVDAAEFAAEPVVGPDPEVVPTVIGSLGEHAGTYETFFAEWDGYGRNGTATALGAGVVCEGRLVADRTIYHAWRAPLDVIRDIAAATDLATAPSASNVIADLVWDAGGKWFVASDVDLASTYVGSRLAMDSYWPQSLEIVRVALTMPLG